MDVLALEDRPKTHIALLTECLFTELRHVAMPTIFAADRCALIQFTSMTLRPELIPCAEKGWRRNTQQKRTAQTDMNSPQKTLVFRRGIHCGANVERVPSKAARNCANFDRRNVPKRAARKAT
jgi:hypothetical protein